MALAQLHFNHTIPCIPYIPKIPIDEPFAPVILKKFGDQLQSTKPKKIKASSLKNLEKPLNNRDSTKWEDFCFDMQHFSKSERKEIFKHAIQAILNKMALSDVPEKYQNITQTIIKLCQKGCVHQLLMNAMKITDDQNTFTDVLQAFKQYCKQNKKLYPHFEVLNEAMKEIDTSSQRSLINFLVAIQLNHDDFKEIKTIVLDAMKDMQDPTPEQLLTIAVKPFFKKEKEKNTREKNEKEIKNIASVLLAIITIMTLSICLGLRDFNPRIM